MFELLSRRPYRACFHSPVSLLCGADLAIVKVAGSATSRSPARGADGLAIIRLTSRPAERRRVGLVLADLEG
ncbi:MAG: hypothetical protein ACREJ0_04485, partial [Geminicoccaceae bacterium]